MIISASRRTDIPALYSTWLMNRLQEGFLLVPNPRSPQRLGRVELSTDKVDCIVFWTKNPKPMFDKLEKLDALGYPFYFQFTLTPYDQGIECGLPPKAELRESFVELSQRIGPERLVWRYDPVFLDAAHPSGVVPGTVFPDVPGPLPVYQPVHHQLFRCVPEQPGQVSLNDRT